LVSITIRNEISSSTTPDPCLFFQFFFLSDTHLQRPVKLHNTASATAQYGQCNCTIRPVQLYNTASATAQYGQCNCTIRPVQHYNTASATPRHNTAKRPVLPSVAL